MNILIVEDEELAVKKMKKTLMQVEPTANVVGITESIQSTVEWLENNNKPDLILMDIELSDGQSFEIFSRVKVNSAVIFTTSYDEYALKAFKVNSIDYLLKPIQSEDLEAAIGKYKSMRSLYKDQGSGSPDFNL
jgi:two-component system, LytTR family, response regulator LytT